MKDSICFDDVLLEPQYSEIQSRTEIDISSFLNGVGECKSPIISAPMDTITESEMAMSMFVTGGFGIIHRYNSIPEQCSMVRDACFNKQQNLVGVAVGVNGEFVERAKECINAGAKIICIDVAHGHHSNVRYALKVLRNTLGSSVHIMAGNVATLAAFNDLADWGADSIRVGIGGGSICSTRTQTGHGVPTLQSIINCSRSDRDATLVADGGIKTSGDVVKALAAGADFVMLGSMLAGTSETPGAIFNDPKRGHTKIYRGMASKEAQNDWRGKVSSIEGITHTVPYKGSVENVLQDIKTGIKSGLSYSGANTIPELQSKAIFIKQSTQSTFESSTHIISRF
tara:strand:- start:109 stop:1131 length:1023 start_codon:yes stop_codon:yes gene_type:complete